jgi:hypothetical protein
MGNSSSGLGYDLGESVPYKNTHWTLSAGLKKVVALLHSTNGELLNIKSFPHRLMYQFRRIKTIEKGFLFFVS